MSWLDDPGPVVLDGPMGTELMAPRLAPDGPTALFVLDAPDEVGAVHRAYVEAGARVVYTNTFGANRVQLEAARAADRLAEINAAAVGIARRAASAIGHRAGVRVAGNVGPTGLGVGPEAGLLYEAAVDVFEEQIRALVSAGVDAIAIETMVDLVELRAAVEAANRCRSGEALVACVSVFEGGNSLAGESPAEVAAALCALGADAVGANCSDGPASLLPLVERLAASGARAIVAKPNAGVPVRDASASALGAGGALVYPESDASMARWAARYVAAGARMVGACCGATPATIAAIAREVGALSRESGAHDRNADGP